MHWEVRWPNSLAGQHRTGDFYRRAFIEDIFFRNYDHVSGLWNMEQWLPQTSVSQARAHYAAYSVQRTDGLRVISLNTDLCKYHCVPRSKMS